MKTVCIVQARLNSRRLPGKVLLPLNGRTVIAEVLTRCNRIAGIDEVICAIPTTDTELAKEAGKYATVAYGPEDDVLARYVTAARGADVIMRITADCPHLSPELCSDVLRGHLNYAMQYSSNVHPRTFPKGLDCEVFSKMALMRADIYSELEEREHVTPWMLRARDIRRWNLQSPWPMDGRLTLDTEDDYRVICAAFGHAPYETGKRIRAA